MSLRGEEKNSMTQNEQTNKKTYMFIGKPDKKFPKLKTGETYSLNVKFYGLSRLLHGVAVQITTPISCPYSSQSAFYKNWRTL